MKILNLTILLQQLENYKNFYYNIIMKTKEEINKLAKEIADLELKIKSSAQDKSLQSYMRRIEIIMESLSIKEGLELNDAVIKLLENN